MEIYLETIEELEQLADAAELKRSDDVSIYLERFSDLELMATGVYAEVYDLPGEPDKVVKVCLSEIDGYYLFAQWCMRPQNQDNPHIPTIHREDVITLPSGKVVRFYVMERLEEISDTGREATLPSHFHDSDFGLLWGALRTITMPYAYNKKAFAHEVDSVEQLVDKIQDTTEHFYMNSASSEPAIVEDQVIEQHQDLLETLFEVLSHVSLKGVVDLHGGNYMLRGDTIVVTDPISHQHPPALQAQLTQQTAAPVNDRAQSIESVE
ncbi:hypothetical protein [Ferrimonas senticii]|uniref:hypothetical protein n=1 Tax=Ferrimonas senticii TaxID=394566 RepID=UPI0003FA6043|nr:hypothetical protein [Ferrimonas senticii]